MPTLNFRFPNSVDTKNAQLYFFTKFLNEIFFLNKNQAHTNSCLPLSLYTHTYLNYLFMAHTGRFTYTYPFILITSHTYPYLLMHIHTYPYLPDLIHHKLIHFHCCNLHFLIVFCHPLSDILYTALSVKNAHLFIEQF